MGFDLSLMARLGMDSTGFDRTLAAAEGKATKTFSSIGSKLAAVFSVGAITVQARKAIDFASRITDLSEALGVSAVRLQDMDFAARQSGASLDDMATAMRKLGEARAKALNDPGGKEAKAFEAFGIDLAFLKANTDPAELFARMSDAVQDTNINLDTMPQILDLIGERNQGVIAVMAAGLRDAEAAAHDLGQDLDDDVRESLDALCV
jgi:hypothetical protein